MAYLNSFTMKNCKNVNTLVTVNEIDIDIYIPGKNKDFKS